jgi:hypothetical protein
MLSLTPESSRGAKPMPLYLVRWPDLSAALVKAASEDELVEILDEVDNPEACTWSVYRSPVFLEFSLPASFMVRERGEGETRPTSSSDVVVGDVSRLQRRDPLEISFAGETGWAMCQAIEEKVFPNVYEARQHRFEEELDAGALGDAVRADLEPLVRASWRLENVSRAEDPASQLATMMGAPVRLARQWIAIAEKKGKPKPPGKKPRRKGRR